MKHRYRSSQWVPYPVEFVFAFFANPANLPRLQPSWQRARIDEIEMHPAPPSARANNYATVAAGRGTRVKLSFRPAPLAPIRVAWTARIEDFHWNERFCDRQIEGPFRYWRQCHRMQPWENSQTGEPGTLLIDTIEYQLPFGPLGRLARRLAFERVLDGIFAHRHMRTEELLRELSERAESLV
jgi:ligand-binding SRPBCC domain-containing protein